MTETHPASAADRSAQADTSATPALPAGRRSGGDYRVELADLGMASAQIAPLWIDNLDGYTAESAARKLRVGYAANPAGTGAALLLRCGADEQPVGVQCLHPRRFHRGSRVLNAAAIADFAVARDHRSLGPALMLIRAIASLGSERFDLVYGLPNPSATAVCRRGGLRQIGAVQRYVKVLRWQYLLARRVPSWMAHLLSALVEPARRVFETARRAVNLPWLHWRECGWSEPALDSIWSRRPADLLLSERSAAMLDWRFGDAPGAPWRLGIAADAGGTPQGYVVWRLHDRVAEVGDVFAVDPARHLAPVLLCFFGAAAGEGAASVSVEFAGPPALLSCLHRAGMAPRGQPSPVFDVPPREGAEPAVEADRWYLTRFDNDSD